MSEDVLMDRPEELAGDEQDVMVTVLPKFGQVKMQRNAALHLFRLIQQYNGCLRDPLSYERRWGAFWPMLSDLERKVMVLCVKANTGCAPGKRLRVSVPPVDFEMFEENCGHAIMTSEVETEFRRVLTLHYGRLVSSDEVHHYWITRCPKESGLLLAMGVIDTLLDVQCGFHSDLIAARCGQLLRSRGWNVERAARIGLTLGLSLDALLIERELKC